MSRWRPLRDILLATSALAPLSLTPALANPQGGQVVGGAATIQSQGSTLTVNQTSDRAAINWQTFNIGAGETTRFVQPSASAIVLNRVTGGLGPSFIDGTLTANGRVFLINADGVMIARGAVIDTAGFLATTNDIRNVDFMAGRYDFSIAGRPDASIVNAGTITASNAGFAALVAPGVRNSGTITATFGKIGLASGNGFTLDFYGDKLITLNVSDSIAATVKDVSTGKALTSLVSNDGKLKANGGQVQLSAVTARKIVDSVINTSGVIEARSIGHRNGKIVLGGPTVTTKVAGTPTQTVKVSGKLNVSGKKKGTTGGTIQVTGENIVVANATLDASGKAGGGKVLIGGDIGGGNPSPLVASIVQARLESSPVPNATTVSIDGASTINASATSSGNGGKVVVWSDGSTSFAGAIAATGGATTGNGGFVEVSGHQTLAFTGTVDTKAPNGSYGTLLLDPGNVTIGSGSPKLTADDSNNFTGGNTFDSFITPWRLEEALRYGSVIISTATGGSPSGGNIVVASSFSWGGGSSNGSSLTLNAYHDVVVNNGVTIANHGSGNLTLRADSMGRGSGTVRFDGSGGIDFSGASTDAKINIFYNPTSFDHPTDYASSVFVPDQGQLTAFMLVNTAGDLQNVATNLAGTYALGGDINLSSVANFAPLGTFLGVFDGQNQTIRNLTIAPTSPSVPEVGLFGIIDSGAVVRDLTLRNVTITANPNVNPNVFQSVGALAGISLGTIRNVHVTGTNRIDGGSLAGLVIGGLVGDVSDGTIVRSSAAVTVTAGSGLICASDCSLGANLVGGLVGFNGGAIAQSWATGDVTVNSNTFAGGLVGMNLSTPGAQRATITGSFATGNVTATGTNVQIGGLVGYNSGISGDRSGSGIILNSRATGDVTANAASDQSGCTTLGSCTFVNAGGLVGFNQGLILGSDAPDVRHNPANGDGTYATGAVSVGSNGVGGGLVGFNDGIVRGALATGAVTGSAGNPALGYKSDGLTTLGGLAGSNQGRIVNSKATGDVGAEHVAYLQAGGLVGDNSGTIRGGLATGAVTTGDSSAAGGLVGSSGPNSGDCGACAPGLGHNNRGLILGAIATGAVTGGDSSYVGGLAGTLDGKVLLALATGAVSAGADSAVGGLAGAAGLDSLIALSAAAGSVTSTGAGSAVGGLIGANAGAIVESVAIGAVSGTSNSYLGGFAGINIGSIFNVTDLSSVIGGVSGTSDGYLGGLAGTGIGSINLPDLVNATGPVTGSGANNVAGGLVGFNAGLILSVSSSSSVTSGPNSIVGSLVGANTGVILDSHATGPGAQIGIDGPTTASGLPPFPTTITGCVDPVCAAFAAASVLPEPGSTTPDIPDDVIAPILVVTLLASPSPADHAVAAAIVLSALTAPDLPPPDGGAGRPGPGAGPGPGFNGGQPYAPHLELRPIAGPGGERFSGIPPIAETRFFTDQVLLQVPANVSPDEVARVARELGLSIISTQNLTSSGRIAFQLRLANGRTVRDVIRALEANRITAIAQPNYRFSLMQPAAGEQQSDNPQYAVDKMHLTEAHRTVSGTGVTIAVIDSEVDQTHTELKGAVSQELNVLGADVKAHPHGTAMVGAIASRDRLTGVAPGARILAVRAFGETAASAEGTTYNILKGIEWAVSQGARVINMSFAGPYDPSLARALKTAADKGVVLISAAGNAGPKSPALFPGADPNVIAVTATDSTDKLFRMANQGGYVSVSAPGVEVLAPAPEEAYQMSTGTSIATAHVSGVVALMLERDPALTPAEVRKILETTATDLGPRGKDNQFGWGLINAQKALAAVDARRKAATSAKP